MKYSLKLFNLIIVILLSITLVSASYSAEANYTIKPFYDAIDQFLGVDNSSNIIGASDCTGLCFSNSVSILMFNNSNGSYLIPLGSKFNSIFFNFTVNSVSSGRMNITSNAGYNITNDGAFSTNNTNLNSKGFMYYNNTGLTTGNYQINLGSRAVSDYNNNSINYTFGLYLPKNIMEDADRSYRINSSEANNNNPFIIVQKICQPTGQSIWIIPTDTTCIVTNEFINVTGYGYRIDGTLILINSTLIRNKSDTMFYTGTGIKFTMIGNSSRIVYN